ncbi:MAG: DUF2071 domain-containing protein [Verrucomicrobiae bacterium]|nr:DUF2071 domain-containing protein [Verrucomicrobiae bacterium]
MNPPSLTQREAARTRPEHERPAMRQTWSELLFLHWKGDPNVWTRTLPAGLHLDTHDGAAWIGVVPFRMDRIRPYALPPLPWLSWFLELNVRTYVHDDEGNPAVWFYSLDTNRWPAYKIARSAFKLPYFHSSMRTRRDAGGWIDYRCSRRGENESANFLYRPVDRHPAIEASPGTLEFFLLERYFLFSHDPFRNRFYSGQVHHAPYRFREVELKQWSMLPAKWDGLPPLEGPPDHSCAVEAVDVDLFALRDLTAS